MDKTIEGLINTLVQFKQMANPFLSKKIIVSAAVFFGGLLIAFGVLISANFNTDEFSVASESAKWTQSTGRGISVPACNSSSTSGTCSGGTALVNIDWSGSPHGGSMCGQGIILCFLSIDGTNIKQTNGSSYTWSGAPNTFHTYQVQFIDTRIQGAGGFIFNPVSAQNLAGVEDGSFTAPNCVPPPPPPPTASLSANPTTINRGQSSTLTWASTNATSCSINQGVGGVATSGSAPVSPSVTTTYTLTCSGQTSPSANSSATVTVNQPPGDFNLNLGGSVACNSAPLSWTASSGATAYRILKGTPRVDISPYQPYAALNFTDTTVSQNTTYQYQIEAYNGAGTNRSNTINITTPYCPPTLSFSGSPTSIFQGQSTTLNWSTSFVTSCAASGAWSGSKPVNGSEVIIPSPPPSVVYNLTCSGSGGTIGPRSVTVNITPLALPEFKEIIPR